MIYVFLKIICEINSNIQKHFLFEAWLLRLCPFSCALLLDVRLHIVSDDFIAHHRLTEGLIGFVYFILLFGVTLLAIMGLCLLLLLVFNIHLHVLYSS